MSMKKSRKRLLRSCQEIARKLPQIPGTNKKCRKINSDDYGVILQGYIFKVTLAEQMIANSATFQANSEIFSRTLHVIFFRSSTI